MAAPLLHFLRFSRRVLWGFVLSGGVDLAGAVAYNALLSIIPLFVLAAAMFARFVDRERFIAVVMREIAHLVPADLAAPLMDAMRELLEGPHTLSLLGVITLLFFSTLAFRTLQHALDIVFRHRRDEHPPRPLLASAVISIAYVVAIGFLSLLQTLAAVGIGRLSLLAGHLPRGTGLLGLLGMIGVFTSIYLWLPFGKGELRTALIGGTFAALAWRGVQALLVWYMQNVSSVNLIYGSMAAVIVVLFSFELAAGMVLLGAQLMAELEKSWKAGRRWYEAPD